MVLNVTCVSNCLTAMVYVALFYCHILVVITAYNDDLLSVPERIPIGALFPHGANHLQLVFKQTIHQHNSNASQYFMVETATEFVDHNDPTSAVRQLQCLHFNRGIYAFLASTFGAFTYKSALSFANAYMVPYIGVSPLSVINEKSNYNNHKEFYGINLEPNHWPAIISVLKWYKWDQIIYLYDSDYGVFNLQEMLKYAHNSNHELKLTLVKRVNNAGDGYRALKSLDNGDRDSLKYVLVNCNHLISKAIIAYHIQDNDMRKQTFHYLLTNLMLNDSWSREVPAAFNAVNITSFAVPAVKQELKTLSHIKATAIDGQHRHNEIPTLEESLVYDGTKVLLEAFNNIIRSRINITKALESDTAIMSTSNFTRKDIDLTCPTLKPFKFGDIIANHLRLTSLFGITGYIQFDGNGNRKNYTIEIFETSNNGYFEKIAMWSDITGLTVELNERLKFHDRDMPIKQNITLTVTSILEEPFLIKADIKDGKSLIGNDRYEGYLKDLTDMIANELDISYSITLVNDSKYGSVSDYGWNGMIQELIDNRVDMAIAPLTITARRQKVVDFTQPFMTTGISIMIKKPTAYSIAMPFLNPLPKEVWAIIIIAFFAVTVIFYVASKLSFRRDVSDCHSDTNNRVSICSSLWYSFGVLVYQVAGIFPNSISGRIISSVWWLFAFISVTTYLTNLTAQSVANRLQSTLLSVLGNYDLSSDALLYKEQMILPILSAEDLVKQTRIEYGTLVDSSTQLFFKNSLIKTYTKMWNHMSQKNIVFVKSYREGIEKVRQSDGRYAFLLEAAMNEYTNDREPCDTIKIGKNLNQVDYGIALPLGSPLRERLNTAILKFREQGDLMKLQHKWWNDRSQCQLVRHRVLEQSSTETTFYNIFFGVIVLAIGLVLAFLISIIEFFLNRKISYSTTRRSDYTPTIQEEKLIEESDTPKQSILKRSLKES